MSSPKPPSSRSLLPEVRNLPVLRGSISVRTGPSAAAGLGQVVGGDLEAGDSRRSRHLRNGGRAALGERARVVARPPDFYDARAGIVDADDLGQAPLWGAVRAGGAHRRLEALTLARVGPLEFNDGAERQGNLRE